ncbi:MAG: DNA methyltransferase [Caldilineaceae bacterium]
MLGLKELLVELNYDRSLFYRRQESDFEPETVHLFRAVREIQVDGYVDGIYVFETSPHNANGILPAQPAVYVATAKTEKDARELHRSLWNLCYAPFLIVTLPHQIRIYTGFNYSTESESVGLLESIETSERLRLLANFAALAIDSTQIWHSEYGKQLNPNQRVDKQLLQNLQQLGNILEKRDLRSDIAHALIGKYVYFSYLRDRNILSDEWLDEQGIDPQAIFTYKATVSSLRALTISLERRFNGQIFPIDFSAATSLKDEHVSWVASVFRGDKLEETPEIVRQLYLPFKAYDFKYIPVETLSSIYEQFIHERKKKGAIYTPEVVADYLLSEMESVKKLQKGMRILDPACGSGVFLVLAYRRLIEKEMQRQGESLSPEELRAILLESIYGVEKELDACFVTEFSLILTLLHYVEPPELHKNLLFQFPALHNTRIYHGDFFDPQLQIAQSGLQFDWIIGNPPWVPASAQEQPFAYRWIQEKAKVYPVGDKRVAEAFSWRAGELIEPDGTLGLLMPATTLVNLKSKRYRQQFFSKYKVVRVTNFANLRDVLFDKRGTFPAATLIYRNNLPEVREEPIIHYGPFAINQVSDGSRRPWVLTINENEIQYIESKDAQQGETRIWKLALWGTQRDKRALERMQYLFPFSLKDFCRTQGWGDNLPQEGAQLRTVSETSEDVEYIADLQNLKQFNSKQYNTLMIRPHFFLEPSTLENNDKYFLRLRGGRRGLEINKAPHIFLHPSWNFVVYSEEDFIIQPRQMGIAASGDNPSNRMLLKALAAYLNSSLVRYYLFFQVPQWGFFSQRESVVTSEVRKIPVPDLTHQAEELANLYDELANFEKAEIQRMVAELGASVQPQFFTEKKLPDTYNETLATLNDLSSSDKEQIEQFSTQLETVLQDSLDSKLQKILDLPDDLWMLSKEFVRTKLALDIPSAVSIVTSPPDQVDLVNYARELRQELDEFCMGTAHHRVTLTYGNQLIECEVEITNQSEPHIIDKSNIRPGSDSLMKELSHSLTESISQWAYVQRGLRLFDGSKVYIYKPSRLIDWTRTQALQDANDIINSVLTK